MRTKNRLRLVHNDDIKNKKTGDKHGKKERTKRRPITAARIVLVLVLLFVVFLFGSGLVKGLAIRFLVKTVPVKISVLEDYETVEFLVIRKEKAVSASASGSFNKHHQEGERVAKDTIIGELLKEEGTSLQKTVRMPITAPWAGVLSYKTDGYESICNPEIWSELDMNQIVEMEKRLERQDSGDDKNRVQIEAGQLLFKIVDNLTPYYLFVEMDVSTVIPDINGSTDLELEYLNGMRIQGKILDLVEEDSVKRVLFEIPSIQEIRNIRIIRGKVIVNSFKGTILDRETLVEQGGRKGVYLLKKGTVTWQEVSIAGAVDDKVSVENLAEGDWVIVTPGIVKEGQRIMFSQ